jgi:taurine dioxygenase
MRCPTGVGTLRREGGAMKVAMELVPLSAHTGVEVRGVDLGEETGAETADALRRGLVEHHLLVFRGQELSVADQQRAGGVFGELVDEGGDGARHVFVSNARDDGVLAAGKPLLFHSDNMFTDAPLAVDALYGLVIEGDVAPTRFANAERACAQLDDETRAALADARALNLSGFAGGWYRYRDADTAPHHPRAEHPVIFRNPRTGHDVLAVSEQQTDRIVGWDPDRSEAMLASLCALLYQPDNIVTHHWRTGDLVVWDNLALQHGRPADGGGGVGSAERTLRRVAMVEGDADAQRPWTRVALEIDRGSSS